MRTTITLDDEVAALLKRAMKRKKVSFKDLVNTALKSALLRDEVKEPVVPYRTEPYDGGKLLIGDVSNIGEILARLDEKTDDR
jgi:hypothetical protein